MREHRERAPEPQQPDDAFCDQAQHRGKRLFHELWSNDAVANYRLALDGLSGRRTLLEAAIIDPSAGDGPTVPSGETDRRESGRRRRDDGRPRAARPTATPPTPLLRGSDMRKSSLL
jgi:hypothetical protein